MKLFKVQTFTYRTSHNGPETKPKEFAFFNPDHVIDCIDDGNGYWTIFLSNDRHFYVRNINGLPDFGVQVAEL